MEALCHGDHGCVVLTSCVPKRFLVTTDNGDVLVSIDPDKAGLDADLLILEAPTSANSADIAMNVPLRAFGAKMLELIEAQGGEMPGGERMRRMMIQEKASADLNRIERWARDQPSS